MFAWLEICLTKRNKKNHDLSYCCAADYMLGGFGVWLYQSLRFDISDEQSYNVGIYCPGSFQLCSSSSTHWFMFLCHFHAYSSMSDCRFWFPESINSTEQHYFTIGLWDHYWRMVHEIQLAMKAWYFKNGFSRPTDHGLFGSDFTLSLKNVV